MIKIFLNSTIRCTAYRCQESSISFVVRRRNEFHWNNLSVFYNTSLPSPTLAFLQHPPLDCSSRRGIENYFLSKWIIIRAAFFTFRETVGETVVPFVNIGGVVEVAVGRGKSLLARSMIAIPSSVKGRDPVSSFFLFPWSGIGSNSRRLYAHARIVFIRRKWLTVKIDDLPCVRARVEMGMMQLAWIKVSGRPSPPAVRPTDHQLSHPPVLILLTF